MNDSAGLQEEVYERGVLCCGAKGKRGDAYGGVDASDMETVFYGYGETVEGA